MCKQDDQCPNWYLVSTVSSPIGMWEMRKCRPIKYRRIPFVDNWGFPATRISLGGTTWHHKLPVVSSPGSSPRLTASVSHISTTRDGT